MEFSSDPYGENNFLVFSICFLAFPSETSQCFLHVLDFT